MRTEAEALALIIDRLSRENLSIAPDAMLPLDRIDFPKLVNIYDHEEHFLEQTFLDTLVGLPRARRFPAPDLQTITAGDVKTALLMLGTAVSGQAEATISSASKSIIKNACGFC